MTNTLALLNSMAASVWGDKLANAERVTRAACAESLEARNVFIATGLFCDAARYAAAMVRADNAMIAEARARHKASAGRLGVESSCASIDRVLCHG